MTTSEAREVFNKALAETSDPDARAKIELLREYFCNAGFRTWMHNETWQITNAK